MNRTSVVVLATAPGARRLTHRPRQREVRIRCLEESGGIRAAPGRPQGAYGVASPKVPWAGRPWLRRRSSGHRGVILASGYDSGPECHLG
jgi:hypothetical protein